VTLLLPPIGDPAALHRTRESWHAVAEHVLAAARYAAEGRIGLVATPGGFGMPPGTAPRTARVAGRELVVHAGATEHAETLTTLGAAAGALGVEPGAPPVYTPSTALEPEAPLVVDGEAAHVLAAWFDLGWSVVGELGAPVTLWPEHFDVACEQGDETAGRGGTFGASPGDAEHPEPYLYVTHWTDVPDDPYWNDDAFAGASLGYREVAAAPDPFAVATAFFEAGRRLLTRA
jgi:hypothetical protein